MSALPDTSAASPRPGRRRPPVPKILRPPVLAVLTLALSAGCSEIGRAEPAQPEAHRLVVTLVPGGEPGAEPEARPGTGRASAELEEAVRDGGFFRWYADRLEGWRIEVRRGEPSADSDGSGRGGPDVEVTAGLLPLPEGVRTLAAELPVALDGSTIGLDGTTYAEPGTTVAVRLAGSARQGGAGSGDGSREPSERWLVTGGEAGAVAEAVDLVLIQAVRRRQGDGGQAPRFDYIVQENRWLQRLGSWRATDGRWEVDPAADRDSIGERDRWFRGLEPIEAGPVRLLVGAGSGDEPRLRALAAELGRSTKRMLGRLGGEAATGGAPALDRPVSVAVEEDHVSQIRHTGAMGVAVPGGGADLHLVLHPEDRWALDHDLARHLLERSGLAAGRPVWAVEGTALWLAGGLAGGGSEGGSAGWYGRPYHEWLPALSAADAFPTGAELLAAERQGADSAPLWAPVAAAVVERLPGATAAAKLAAFAALDEAAARERLVALREEVSAGEAPETPDAVAPPRQFLRGVSLAHPNSLTGGYHAPSVDRRLAELQALGVDSVSLMPFAYQRDPRAPEMVYLNRTPLSEHDTGTIHAARAAHARGLAVLWKPHIWVAHDSWPGEIEMDSGEDWAAWWRLYRRFVLHHAMLASYAGAELFSVGVELERTVERPEWVPLVEAVRRLYPGPVTYAANWGSGADRVRFWSHLDLVGIDAYYPLTASEEESSPERLAEGARRVAARLRGFAERTGKPVVLTEVGFAARRAAWVKPHERGGEYSAEDQARAYEALLGALEGSMADGEWLRGVYLWKVFSGDRSWRGEQADFRFLGRPAEQVVARYFRRSGMSAGATP